MSLKFHREYLAYGIDNIQSRASFRHMTQPFLSVSDRKETRINTDTKGEGVSSAWVSKFLTGFSGDGFPLVTRSER